MVITTRSHPGKQAAVRNTPAGVVLGKLRAAVVAGAMLTAGGVIILMGIITAEAVYPDRYTTHDNEISDLGATVPPNSIIRQPSAHIFNATMMLSGATILIGSVFLHRAFHTRRATISLGLLGMGVLGVGLFPGDRAPMHGLFAMLAFVSGGVACILGARLLSGPFRLLSIAFGTTTLVSLALAMVGDATLAWDKLGDGGVERWISYPVVLWLTAFGGYLMGSNSQQRPEDRAP